MMPHTREQSRNKPESQWNVNHAQGYWQLYMYCIPLPTMAPA